MKVFRLLAALLTLTVAACGQGSVHSPDFRPVFNAFTSITPQPVPSVPLGATQPLTAYGTYSVPPGAPAATPVAIPDASWTSGNVQVATVNSSGVVTGVSQGSTTITAQKNGLSISTNVTVIPPTLNQVVIVDQSTQLPASSSNIETAKSIAVGTQANFEALGSYSNTPSGQYVPLNLGNGSTITWAQNPVQGSTPPGGLSQSPALPASGSAILSVISASAAKGGTAGTTQFAVTVADPNTPAPVTANVVLNVNAVTLTGFATPGVILNPSQIAPKAQSQATAYGLYSDGSTQAFPNDGSAVTWSNTKTASETTDAATVDATTGVATGVVFGTENIIATLKNPPAGSTPTASAVLSVTNPACPNTASVPNAMLASNGAKASSASNGLCLGCSTNPNPPMAVVTGDLNSFDTMSVPVGLLGAVAGTPLSPLAGSESITVKAASTVTPVTGQFAGFIIGQPTGQLLLASLLSQVQVNTLFQGAVQETSTNSNTLILDLLGMRLVGPPSSLVLAAVPVTKPFDSVQLVFNSGLVTALSTLQVYSACSTAVPAAQIP